MTPDVGALLDAAGLPALLALAFGGGVLLSLTPCVYPMIPVTVAAFGARRASRGRRFALSLAYVFGMASTYAVLGVWAASTGRVFGAALADPRVTGTFALLFAALAAVSFGWLPAVERALSHTPAWATRLGGASLGGAYAMGLVAGVVFAPCVGPVVVGILAYVATTGDIALGGGLLATVALGMGAPFLLVGTFSGELLRLPRMGGAPGVVRFILGGALLVAALYYLRLTVSAALFRVLAVSTLALLGLDRLAAARRDHSRTWSTTGVALLFLAGAVGFLPPRAGGPPLAWRTDVEAALADAREARRFAVIDFTAEWCLACHELDLVTFRDPDVARLLEETERIRVDATRMTEAVEELFARFGVLALPAVVVVDPDGTVVKSARIVSFVPPEEALALFRRAGIQPRSREAEVPVEGRLQQPSPALLAVGDTRRVDARRRHVPVMLLGRPKTQHFLPGPTELLTPHT